ncbi:MAG: peptidase C39 [Alphaproteobacteria bacterium]|nr:peptidase C39 [Alphaproteobacteria bacterium]
MLCGLAQANDFGLVGGNRAFSLQVTSFRAQRFESVIPQHYDYSCGSAALATLLKYHYDIPVTEQEVLDAMYQAGDQEKIRTQGFSLLDMRRYLETMELRADGFQVDLDKVKAAGIPGIVLINTNGYMHFVVLKGISLTHVLLGDPALGTRKLAHGDFQKMWNGIFFVIRNQTDLSRMSFDYEDGWDGRRAALFRTALTSQTLSSIGLHSAMAPGIHY